MDDQEFAERKATQDLKEPMVIRVIKAKRGRWVTEHRVTREKKVVEVLTDLQDQQERTALAKVAFLK